MKKKKVKDLTEELFGKKPKKGFKFKYVDIELVDSENFKGFLIRWFAHGIGFGEVWLGWGLDTQELKEYPKQIGFHSSTECMSEEFLKAVMKKAIPKIIELMLKSKLD